MRMQLMFTAGLCRHSGTPGPEVGGEGFDRAVFRGRAGTAVCLQPGTPHQAASREDSDEKGEGQEAGCALQLDL